MAAVVVLLSAALFAQEKDATYQSWMQSIRDNVGTLRKSLEAKSADAVAADAKKLEATFAEVRGFWEKRNAADAVKFATDAGAGFKQIGELAAAGNLDAVGDVLKTTQANCGGCHDAHRERDANNEWVIK
jgi:hypothetical protein